MRPWNLIALSTMLTLSQPVSAAADVDAWIAAQLEAGAVSGAAVVDVDADAMHARGFGRRGPDDDRLPDGDTRFQIGSITKVFTNLLLAELSAADVVAPERTLGSLMPASFRPRNDDVAGITLAALATHTSGLPRLPANLDLGNTTDPYAAYDEAALREGLTGTRAKQRLGSFYTYSNFGAGTLGWLLGRADGRGYHAALEGRVIGPLGLEHTGFRPDDDAARAVSGGKAVPAWGFEDAMAAAGSLWGSVHDLGRLVQAYLGTHEHALKHDLRRDLEVVVRDAGDFAVTRVWHVGYAGDRPIYWHNGGTAGFHSFVGFRPDTRRGVAILVSGDADPTGIGLQALGFTPRTGAAPAHDESVFGQYRLSDAFGFGVYVHDGVLVTQATGQPAFELHALGEDWYALGDVDASVRFVRRGDEVVAAELVQNGVVQRAERVAAHAVAVSREAIELEPRLLAEYVGTYAFAPGVVFTVRRDDRGLEAQLSGQPFFPIHASARDRFFYKVVDAQLTFERDAEGRVAAVVLHQGGIDQRAPRE